jgi:hypothetical protein
MKCVTFSVEDSKSKLWLIRGGEEEEENEKSLTHEIFV